MKTYAKLAIAAAAVSFVAIGGFSELSSLGVVGGPPSGLPSVAATSPTLEASSRSLRSYVLSSPRAEVHLKSYRDLLYLGLSVTPYDVSHVVTNVCTDESHVETVRVGPTVDDLTTALTNQIGVRRSGPTDTLLGGYPAKKFEFSLLPECPGREGHGLWADPTRTYGFWLKHREKGSVYIVDVDGEPLVITSQHSVEASAEYIADLEAIIASIDIVPVSDPGPRTGVSDGGWLLIGEHALTVDGVALSFSVPALGPDSGWARYGSLSISKDTWGGQAAEAVIYWTAFPDGLSADPCRSLLSLPADASIGDLAAAVSAAAGAELLWGPVDSSVGGHPAKHLVLVVREDLGCDPGYFFTSDPPPGGPGWWETDAGDTIRVWVVDVDGTRIFIVGETTADASPGLQRELEDIVASIRFDWSGVVTP